MKFNVYSEYAELYFVYTGSGSMQNEIWHTQVYLEYAKMVTITDCWYNA
jgi:hypothetical protein